MSLAITVVIVFLSFTLIEKPLMRYGSRIGYDRMAARPRPTPTRPVAAPGTMAAAGDA